MTGVGALWTDHAFWFETGARTRKGRNLARDPRCTLSLATSDFDVVVEGEAEIVTERDTVAALAARWSAEGWPARVDDSGTALTAEFERAVGRAPAVERLPAHPARRHRAADRRARRRHPLDVLSRAHLHDSLPHASPATRAVSRQRSTNVTVTPKAAGVAFGTAQCVRGILE